MPSRTGACVRTQSYRGSEKKNDSYVRRNRDAATWFCRRRTVRVDPADSTFTTSSPWLPAIADRVVDVIGEPDSASAFPKTVQIQVSLEITRADGNESE